MKCKINLMWFLTMMIVVGISNAQPGMFYEHWDTAGSADSMLTEASAPDSSEIVLTSQWDGADTDQYRARLTGYIVPPVTGNYTFWINTDDNGRLWLSTDDDPSNAVEIARETGWSAMDSWAAVGDEEVSAPIALVGGNIYWIRGGYQESGGGDHIQIGWTSPEAGIADPTLIGYPYLFATPPDKAYDPSPADGKFFRYSVDATELLWTLPPSLHDPNNEGPGVSCDVLFFTEDPELNPAATGEKLVDYLVDGRVESVALNGLADAQAHYWWRVDCYDPNGDNFVITEGDVWTFSSARDVPMVFIDESGESTAITEVDPAATDDYLISLSMDPGVAVEVTVTETISYNPLTTGKLELETWQGEAAAAPQLQVTHSGGTEISSSINSLADDTEEWLPDNWNYTDSSDLEFFDDGGGQIIGLRFNDVAIAQGATIDSAIVEFEVDVAHDGAQVYGIITGENVDNAPEFIEDYNVLQDRLAANPTSSIPFAWTDDYAVDEKVMTPDIASIIQEIVNRPGWTTGSSIVIFFEEDMNPWPDDIEFVGVTSTTYTLDSSNWDGVTNPVTVTIKAVDDDILETDPELVTLTSATSSGDPDWTGLSVADVVVSIGENECGAWPLKEYDFNADCYVNLGDLAMLVADWLSCTAPNVEGCITDYKP